MTTKNKGGRPRQAPTTVVPIRLRNSVLEIIKRRADKEGISVGLFIVDRIIRNEVVRKHRRLKNRNIAEEVKTHG